MKPGQLANMLGVASNTIRRWSNVYADFLSPSARAGGGKARRYLRSDQRILYFVAVQRSQTPPTEEWQIIEQMKRLHENDWKDLPPLPPEFGQIEIDQSLELIPAEQRAREIASLEFFQRENQRLEHAMKLALERAETAQAELNALQARYNALEAVERAQHDDLTARLHTAQLELSGARGEVAALRAQLGAYALGGDQPLPVASLLMRAALWAAGVVLVVLVVGAVAALLIRAL